MGDQPDDWRGTLALMGLRTLETMGPRHGYGLAWRTEQIGGDLPALNYGRCKPGSPEAGTRALHPLAMGEFSRTNRPARFYELTKAEQRRLWEAAGEWKQTTEILARFLDDASEA